MANLATVVSLTGNAFLVGRDGSTRALKAGDTLQPGETVRTSAGAHVELLMNDGQMVAVNADQSVRIDDSMVSATPNAADVAASATPALPEAAVQNSTVETVIQALQRGGDLNQELEAAAAGTGAGGGGDGGDSSFVRLLRVSEGVDPLAYNYQSPDRSPIEAIEPPGGQRAVIAEAAATPAPTPAPAPQPTTTPVPAGTPAPSPSPAPSPAPEPSPAPTPSPAPEPSPSPAPSPSPSPAPAPGPAPDPVPPQEHDPVNTPPTITVTADTLKQGTGAAGQEVGTFSTHDAEDPSSKLQVTFTNANEAQYYQLDLVNNKVLLTQAGADLVNAGKSLPTIDLTVTDTGHLTGENVATPHVIADTPAPTPDPTPAPAPAPEDGGWFIAQQGNQNHTQSYALNEGSGKDAVDTFNVQFNPSKDPTGLAGKVAVGDSVHVTLDIGGQADSSDFKIVGVTGSKEFSIQTVLSDDGHHLTVTLTNVSGHEATLQGAPFSVTVQALQDNVHEGTESLNFTLNSTSTDRGVWVGNDFVNYAIQDNPLVLQYHLSGNDQQTVSLDGNHFATGDQLQINLHDVISSGEHTVSDLLQHGILSISADQKTIAVDSNGSAADGAKLTINLSEALAHYTLNYDHAQDILTIQKTNS